MNDKQLKEKMESLDTLSAGIVYGKEEAWDKLQGRMDKKPAQKIPLKYWMAAAVLLLMVCIAPFYASHKQAVVHNDKPQILPAVPNEVTTKQPEPVVTYSEHTTTHIVTSPLNIKSTRAIKNTSQSHEQIIETVKADVIPPENEIADVPAVKTEPIHPTQMPMKVVHINDIEKGKMARASNGMATAGNEPVTDPRKMRVVHITDVVNEEREMRMLLRENRMTFGRNPFSRMINSDTYSNSTLEDDDLPHHLLKNIFNTQN